MKTTIGRMAKLYGLHRSTLHEAVAKGRISAGLDGKGQRVIDLSEMIRVYGELSEGGRIKPVIPTASLSAQQAPDTDALLTELRLLREEFAGLRAELRAIRDERGERAERPERGATRAQSFADLLAGLD